MARLNHPPKVLALVPCRRASYEATVAAWSIEQTFTAIELEKYPALVPEFHVYVAVERGDADRETIHLALLAPDGAIVSQASIVMGFDTGDVGEVGLPFRATIFRTPGKYILRLFVEGHVLLERTITMQAAAG